MAQTIYTQALSDADKKRIAAAMQQGPGAATSLALQMANTATETRTPPLPTGGATTGGATSGGAVPAQVQTAQAQAQAARAQQEQQRALQQAQKAGDIQTVNSLLSAQTMQRSIDHATQTGNTQLAAQMQQAQAAQARANALNSQQLTPYQAALANTVNLTGTNRNTSSGDPVSPAVQAALGTPQPAEQNKDYLIFGTQDPNFKLGMSDADRASWDAIGAKYAAGDSSWNRDTNEFRENGNWSGYYDDNGNYNGWLRAVDGTGGYAPAFGGKVGESGYKAGTVFYAPDGTAYTLGADGSLRKSGNATVVQYGSYIGPKTGYQDSDFWALEDGQYKRYTNQTAPQEVLNAQGYYRDDNGLVRLMDNDYYIAQGLKNGQITPEQIALGQALKNTGNVPSGNIPSGNIPSSANPTPTNYASEYTSRTTTPTTTPAPTNNQPVQNTQPSQPTQNTQPVQAAPVISNAPAQLGKTTYQQYLDQWEYPDAPEWNGTEYERQRDELLQNAMNPYEGSPYDQQRDDALAQYGEKWQGSEYQPKRDAALERAENMQWNYDPNTDPVWQALQKQYRREGDRATQEAMAQAAMRTGGLANSYAVTAASQAGDYYAAQLSDRLPQLYQDAYQRYLQEFQRQMGISDQYQGFDDREYSRWADQQGKNLDLADRYNQYGQQDYNRYMDRVSQQLQGADRYNNYGGTEYQRYLDQLGQYNTDRNFSYGRYRDAVGDYRYDDETQYNRAWNEEARDYNRAYQAQRDAILDNRADREWAQQLREYADAQNWKATEWEQYLREYGDQLSEKQRQWAYQMQRDAISDERWERQYADQRGDTMYNRALQEDQTAYQRALYDQEYADQRGDTAWEQGYKQTAYNDEMERSALNYLNTNGIVTGRYAEILGVPDGTTYEQYYSRYLGGGSSSPFDETEIPSGTTPKYTPPPGGGDEGDEDETPNDPVYQKIRSKYGEDKAMEVWNLTQQPWFSDLKNLAYSDKDAAMDYLYYLEETGQVSDDKNPDRSVLKILMDMLGLSEDSVAYERPPYGGSTGLYATYNVKGGSYKDKNFVNIPG